MRIGHIEIDYFSHVCFRFHAQRGRTLITDPFFAEGFEYDGHYERHLSPSALEPEDIAKCHVIFVSHAHGDHFDPDAVCTIQQRTGCHVLGPAEVLDVLRARGVRPSHLMMAEDAKRFDFTGLVLHTYGGYDHAWDRFGRPSKFSALIEAEGTSLFYSGDCHELPPRVLGARVDAMFCWPHPDDEALIKLCRGLHPKNFVLMHGDRFEPGEFICNLDMQQQKQRLERLVPKMTVIIPQRVKE